MAWGHSILAPALVSGVTANLGAAPGGRVSPHLSCELISCLSTKLSTKNDKRNRLASISLQRAADFPLGSL